MNDSQAATAYMDLAKSDPVAYAREMLGINPTANQAEILKAAADPSIPNISWRSANGCGKTYITATIICQYLDSHYPGYVVISGASWRSILKTVWPTLRKVVNGARVDLGGRLLATEWIRDDMWGAFCVSPNEPENIGGFRTENGALVIVDEASSLEGPSMDAIRGVCSAAGSKIVLLGNPLTPEGPFFDTFSSSNWRNFHTSAFDVCDLNIPGLATRKWIEEMQKEWGTESPIYKARVLGEFPSSSAYQLVPLEWLSSMTVPRVLKLKGKIRIGVDVARFGDDTSVIAVRDDRCFRDMKSYPGLRTTELAGFVIKTAKEWGLTKNDADQIRIDDTGVGGGVTDRLWEEGWYVDGVNFGDAAEDSERFLNQRSEMYWTAMKKLDPKAEDRVFIPREFEVIAKEMTWPEYKPKGNGQIQLEPKDKIKKRKGRSPDHADAAILTFPAEGYEFKAGAA